MKQIIRVWFLNQLLKKLVGPLNKKLFHGSSGKVEIKINNKFQQKKLPPNLMFLKKGEEKVIEISCDHNKTIPQIVFALDKILKSMGYKTPYPIYNITLNDKGPFIASKNKRKYHFSIAPVIDQSEVKTFWIFVHIVL